MPFRDAVPSVQGGVPRLVPFQGVAMVHRTAYCPAHDRDVPVLLRRSAFEGGARPRHASGAFLCLDYRVRCTGSMCPLMALPATPEEQAAHREGVKRFHGCSPLPLHGSHPRLEDPRS